MHILILGGSGRTGKLVIQTALARGHDVTALVRDPSSLSSLTTAVSPDTNPTTTSTTNTSPNSSTSTKPGTLTLHQGDPTSVPSLQRALSPPPTAIIVTLNSSRTSDSPFAAPTAPPTLMADTHRALITALTNLPPTGTTTAGSTALPKIVTLQAHGVGSSFATLPWPVKLLVRYSNLGIGYRDHEAVEGVLRESGMRYVLVRAVRFAGGDEVEVGEGRKRKVREWGEGGEGVGWLASVGRASVAGMMVDAVEGEMWDGRAVVVSD